MEECCQGMGGMMMLFGLLAAIALVAAAGATVYVVVRALRRNSQNSALSVLDERFARGEIDADEYQQRRSTLGAG